MKESDFQHGLIEEIKMRFPGAIVTKFDAKYKQGFPDLIIFWKDRWAALECKRSATAKHQPNQEHYVDILNRMSFSRFVYPENKEEVLDEMERSFLSGRDSRSV